MIRKKRIFATLLSGVIILTATLGFQHKASAATALTAASPSASTSAIATAKAAANVDKKAPIVNKIKDITIGVGSDELSMNFNWLNTVSTIGTVTISDGTTTQTFAAETVGKVTRMDNTEYSNKVTVTKLKPNTEYTYFVTNDSLSSPKYSFKTASGDTFSFLFAGDPQIGASGNDSDTAIKSDTEGWNNTLTKALSKFKNVDFIYSAGDQINDYANSASKIKQVDGFFSPAAILNTPLAATIGNHDNGNTGGYDDLFNMPNVDNKGGTAYTEGDYSFRYGDTLFLDLNTNNASSLTHKAFMQDAISKNPDAKWRIVVMHHSIYSVASHANDEEILNMRTNLTPAFDDLKIDAVLDGHDHVYVRSYQMLGDKPMKDQKINDLGQVVNPTGTLYVTANSATGSKFYKITVPSASYAAKEEQLNVPEISKIDMTKDTFTISTYRTDTMALTDTYTILKQN